MIWQYFEPDSEIASDPLCIDGKRLLLISSDTILLENLELST